MINQREPVYILIPVHNRKTITLKCLERLSQNGDLTRYHVIIINDGSNDGIEEAIYSLYPEITILGGDGNLWWTGAIKLGMEYAYQQGAEYLLWLNNDCLVSLNTIPNLVSFCHHNPNSIIGCQSNSQEGTHSIKFGGKLLRWMDQCLIDCPQGKIMECDLVSGNLVCFPKSVIDKIGYPPYNLVPQYGGDSLYLMRAKKAGFKIFVDNRTSVFDIGGDSKIAPQSWLLREGKPYDIIRLLLTPYSLYGWPVWLALNQERYGNFIGFFSFIAHYSIRFAIPITVITILRFLPFSIRCQISQLKRKFIN